MSYYCSDRYVHPLYSL